jgi:MscS family membrane protein
VVDVLAAAVEGRLAARGPTAAGALVPIGRTIVKVLVLLFAVLATLQNVGVNVTGLLAGLGIGGLALALAAQKTVENLFGGVSVILDQPVRVGDFCRFGGRVGTVEEVGLRSTRIRTLDRTVVSIPNAEFSALQLENFSRRDRIRLHTMLGLRYETTPDQLRRVLADIGRLLREDPRVDPDPARIRFVGFGAYSLDCEVFAYILTADFGEFLGIREDLFLKIMDIVAASGTSFAFPSQTLYVGADPGLAPAPGREVRAEAVDGRPSA